MDQGSVEHRQLKIFGTNDQAKLRAAEDDTLGPVILKLLNDPQQNLFRFFSDDADTEFIENDTVDSLDRLSFRCKDINSGFPDHILTKTSHKKSGRKAA